MNRNYKGIILSVWNKGKNSNLFNLFIQNMNWKFGKKSMKFGVKITIIWWQTINFGEKSIYFGDRLFILVTRILILVITEFGEGMQLFGQ